MNEYLSKKIKLVSLFSIVAVVFIHAYNYHDLFLQCNTRIHEGMNLGAMVSFFISNGIARFAVPMFFCISGYLFFINFEPTLKCYERKVKSRVKSLFVPFILWILLSGAMIILLAVAFDQYKLPIVDEQVGNMNANGLIGWINSPPAFQLWFIKDLMVLVIFAPIIYWCIKKGKVLTLLVIAALWIYNMGFLVNVEGVLWFNVGAYLAIHNKTDMITKRRNRLAIASLVILVLGCALYTYVSARYSPKEVGDIVLVLLYKFNTVTGVMAVWFCTDYICEKWCCSRIVMAAWSNVFLIYAAHEPLQHVIFEKVIMINDAGFVHMLLYFGLPVVITVSVILLGVLLKKVCPKVAAICTGGRI